MKDINRIRGKQSRAIGELFEMYIDSTCKWYERESVAVIEKTPEPMKVISSSKQGKFTAVFEKRAQPDYKGVIGGGRAVVFEAKHTDGDRIAQSRVTEAQVESLTRYSSLGAECFVLVSVQLRAFYKVPWDTWTQMKSIYGRKHMTLIDLEDYRVAFTGGVIRFLE